MRRQLNVLLLMVAVATPAVAYDLQPARVAKIIKDDTHELLSIASFECMRARRATEPMPELWNCLPDHKNFASDYANDYWKRIQRGRARRDDLLGLKVQYLLAGVRWPDDPMGLARSNNPTRVIANFRRCESWLAGDYGPCGNRFCLSHFGHLQMAHSMEPSAPWCKDRNPCSPTCSIPKMDTNSIPKVDTKSAIEAWVRWLIAIGKGEVGSSGRILDDSFAMKIFDQKCDKVYPLTITYQSLFFTDCSKNPWYQFWNWGKFCSKVKPAEPEVELRARAVGAILHVIQDSYARGHTLRVAESGSSWCSPLISCTKISKFSNYNEQDSGKHGDADHTPTWDISCLEKERDVDDPITAGAKVLAMFEDREYNADKIWEYLADKVFATTSLTPEHLLKDEECFGRK